MSNKYAAAVMLIADVVIFFAGVVATFNLFVGPERRAGGHALDAVMWFGPTLISIAVILPCAGRVEPRRLRHIGFALLLLPVGILVVGLLIGLLAHETTEVIGLYFSFSLLLVPGPALAFIGAASLWPGGRK